ncbi:MAG TPA: pentapeptide repeat-containing protein [Candidatus Angelobacter sp.]
MNQSHDFRSQLVSGTPLRFQRTASRDARSVSAEWIREAVDKSKRVEIWNAVIIGQLDLRSLQVLNEISLVRCTFEGSVDFSYSTFQKNLTISCTTFMAPVNFTGTTFDHDVRFTRTAFRGLRNKFTNTQVKGSFVAVRARFSGKTNFDDAELGPDVNFNYATFKNASFDSTKVKGSAHFERTVFEGDADFTGMEVDGDLDFSDSHFTSQDKPSSFDVIKVGGDLSFDTTIFDGKISFDGSCVRGSASFAASRIHNEADFEDMKVDGDLIFDKAVIEGEATFVGLKIGGGGIFRGAQFCSNAKTRFDLTHFQGGAFFQDVSFTGKADFLGVQIDAGARFNGAKFNDTARFEASRFTGLVEFRSGKWEFTENGFLKTTDYSGASFKEVAFDHARFEQDACFDDAIFNGRVDFRDCTFRAIYFSESGQVMQKDKMQEQFQADVDLRGCTYNQIHVNWESLLNYRRLLESKWGRFVRRHLTFWRPILHRQRPYSRQPYRQLETFFSTAGQPEIGDEIYLECRRIERKQKRQKNFFRWLADFLFYAALARYGVRPLRLIMLSLVLLMGGTLFFSQPHTVKMKEAGAPAPSVLSRLDALEVSLHQFLPVDIPMGEQWVPSPETRAGRLRIKPSTFSTLFLKLPGWILVPLGIAALTGLLRRAGAPKASIGE